MTLPTTLPDFATTAELIKMLSDADEAADERSGTPADAETWERREAHYDTIAARAARWHRVTGRDAGQPTDVSVPCGHGRVAYYRPMRKARDGDPEVMPIPEAIRRTFSEGMQRALWGCVA